MNSVIFFTFGDSNSASTWSNVPYCFTRELERRGITIFRINIEPLKLIRQIYDHTIWKATQFFWPGNQYSFIRTPIASAIIWHRIRNAVLEHFDADLCIFTCYDFYNKYNNIPTLLFCDWTYKILIERAGRTPYFFELPFIKRQDAVINTANYVVSLFPACASRMKLDYPQANIHSFTTNVINLLYDKQLVQDEILKRKLEKKRILFVGNKWYKDALILLLQVCQNIQKCMPDIELYVIGMNQNHTGITAPYIHYLGYLHKDIESERNLYYETLISSSLIVNVSPVWGGYSSIVEAMFFYTPVIVAPYEEFLLEFGKNINFGIYNEGFTEEQLEKSVVRLLTSDNYRDICISAHERVKNYTWKEYVDQMNQIVING